MHTPKEVMSASLERMSTHAIWEAVAKITYVGTL